MLICIVLINILCTSLIRGANITSKHSVESLKRPLYETVTNKQVRLQTEGGTVTTNSSINYPNLPKGNQTILLNVDKEFPISKQKPVKARKGVSLFNVSEESTKLEGNTKPEEIQLHLSSSEKNVINATAVIKSNTEHKSLNFTTNFNTTSANLHDDKSIVVTEHFKKPTLLSYDVLANMYTEKYHDETKLLISKASSMPIIKDKTPSPINANFVNKAHLVGNNRYPGLVTPLVISILVVPVFAVLGYMALKRGREAWKNRHYKRVDFLLDGMYND